MARSISESFDNLSAQIDSLAADFKALGIGVKGRAKLESSSNFEKAIALVENNAFLTRANRIQSSAKDIQRAQRSMRSHPGRWNTPDEYLAYEKEQKDRSDRLARRLRELNKERFDRQQRLSDKILSIKSPDVYRRMVLSREYGDAGASQIISAEQDKEQQDRRDRFAQRERELRRERFDRQQEVSDKILSIKSPDKYRRMMLSREYGDTGANQIIAAEQDKEQQERRDRLAQRERELRKERFDRQQEVSDKIMSIKSPDRYRKMILSRKYGTSNADSIIAAEDAEEQRLRDSRRSISARRYQAEAYRKFPWVKTLVDAGVIQKKELPKITKMLTRVSKVPGLGMMVKHPVAAAIGAGIALTSATFARQDKANKVVTNWEASEAVFGRPSKAFESAMMKAGMSYQEVLSAWAKMSMKYGNPDLVLPMLGSGLSNIKSGIGRGRAAEILGLDPRMATGAMIASGGYAPSEAAEVNAELTRLGKVSDAGWRSGSTFKEKARAVMLSVPWEKDLEARGISWIDILNPISSLASYVASGGVSTVDTLKELDEANEAARSAEEYERNKTTVLPKGEESATQGGNQVTLNVNEIRILDAKDVHGLIQSIASEAGMGYNIDVMNWADSRRVKV